MRLDTVSDIRRRDLVSSEFYIPSLLDYVGVRWVIGVHLDPQRGIDLPLGYLLRSRLVVFLVCLGKRPPSVYPVVSAAVSGL